MLAQDGRFNKVGTVSYALTHLTDALFLAENNLYSQDDLPDVLGTLVSKLHGLLRCERHAGALDNSVALAEGIFLSLELAECVKPPPLAQGPRRPQREVASSRASLIPLSQPGTSTA